MAGTNTRSLKRDDSYFILVKRTFNGFCQDIHFQFSVIGLVVLMNYESISPRSDANLQNLQEFRV